MEECEPDAEIELVSPLHDDDDDDDDDAAEAVAPPADAEAVPLWLAIYVPSMLYGGAKAMSIPLVPVEAERLLKLDDRALGVALSFQGVGKVGANGSGALVLRSLGDKTTLLVGVAGMAAAVGGLAASRGVVSLALSECGLGASLSLLQLGRQSWIRANVGDATRGGAMALARRGKKETTAAGRPMCLSSTKRLNPVVLR